MVYPAEEIERNALEHFHAAAGSNLRAALGLEFRSLAGALISVAGATPPSAIVLNRVLGVGLRGPATDQTIQEVIQLYREAGIRRYFVQLHPEARPDEIAGWLKKRGLEKARGWQKFSRGREAVPEPKSDLVIRKIGEEHAAASAAILSDAFDLGDAVRPWLALLPLCERWHVFMSFDGGRPTGTGALYIEGDSAWMDFGATAPSYRKRGSQSALMCHRLQFALDHGCKAIFTCTGEEVPGDPQHSYSNILKAGFKEDYVRENYAPPKSDA